jgi:hypothetical protein
MNWKNLDGNGRGMIGVIILPFTCRGCGKPRITSVMTAGVPAEIRAKYFPNSLGVINKTQINCNCNKLFYKIGFEVLTRGGYEEYYILRYTAV